MVSDQNHDGSVHSKNKYTTVIKSLSAKRSAKVGGAFLAVSVLVTGVAIAQSDPTTNPANTYDSNQGKEEVKSQKSISSHSSSSSIDAKSSSTTSRISGSKPQAEVKVNGKNIPVPNNGNFHKVIKDKNGNISSITINNSTSSTNSASGSSDTSVDTHSYSDSYISTEGDSL